MSYQFFQNKECEYFPCHEGLKKESFNCLFCYCPLYKNRCKGNFKILSNGIKDCSNCTFPHKRENYQAIIEQIRFEK